MDGLKKPDDIPFDDPKTVISFRNDGEDGGDDEGRFESAVTVIKRRPQEDSGVMSIPIETRIKLAFVRANAASTAIDREMEFALIDDSMDAVHASGRILGELQIYLDYVRLLQQHGENMRCAKRGLIIFELLNKKLPGHTRDAAIIKTLLLSDIAYAAGSMQYISLVENEAEQMKKWIEAITELERVLPRLNIGWSDPELKKRAIQAEFGNKILLAKSLWTEALFFLPPEKRQKNATDALFLCDQINGGHRIYRRVSGYPTPAGMMMSDFTNNDEGYLGTIMEAKRMKAAIEGTSFAWNADYLMADLLAPLIALSEDYDYSQINLDVKRELREYVKFYREEHGDFKQPAELLQADIQIIWCFMALGRYDDSHAFARERLEATIETGRSPLQDRIVPYICITDLVLAKKLLAISGTAASGRKRHINTAMRDEEYIREACAILEIKQIDEVSATYLAEQLLRSVIINAAEIMHTQDPYTLRYIRAIGVEAINELLNMPCISVDKRAFAAEALHHHAAFQSEQIAVNNEWLFVDIPSLAQAASLAEEHGATIPRFPLLKREHFERAMHLCLSEAENNNKKVPQSYRDILEAKGKTVMRFLNSNAAKKMLGEA